MRVRVSVLVVKEGPAGRQRLGASRLGVGLEPLDPGRTGLFCWADMGTSASIIEDQGRSGRGVALNGPAEPQP